MQDESLLELLELYMALTEKQDEIIQTLGKIAKRQATDLQLLQNDKTYEKMLANDMDAVSDTMEMCKHIKGKLEL